ncbi:MAG: hypothetical protein PHW98_06005 [Candidatus Omnitrophica bacterium]|nr:hypothetical protein [Candidatus Omnitrophota bacterium]MDD5771643.1 hypothetical protein [Candidatus Omnitrophota bacterium]
MTEKKEKWYFKSWSLIVSFLFVGPFMLPLVWINPGFSRKKKAVITAVILVLSGLLTAASLRSLKYLDSYYRMIQQDEIY